MYSWCTDSGTVTAQPTHMLIQHGHMHISTQAMLSDIDTAELESCKEHFVKGCELECMFWDQAWEMQRWRSFGD